MFTELERETEVALVTGTSFAVCDARSGGNPTSAIISPLGVAPVKQRFYRGHWKSKFEA